MIYVPIVLTVLLMIAIWFSVVRSKNHISRSKTMPFQKRALIDFDGVIHQYSKGWDDGTAYDIPMPGAFEGLEKLEDDGYEVVIFSTRDRDQIIAWLDKWAFPRYRVTNIKEPAQFILDDRAVHFDNWPEATQEIEYRFPPQPTLQQE